jgi:hypothetical protein
MTAANELLVSIDDAVALIRKETGIPITKSRIHKDSAKCVAPKPAAIFGRRYLWRPNEMVAYARTLIQPVVGTEAA